MPAAGNSDNCYRCVIDGCYIFGLLENVAGEQNASAILSMACGATLYRMTVNCDRVGDCHREYSWRCFGRKRRSLAETGSVSLVGSYGWKFLICLTWETESPDQRPLLRPAGGCGHGASGKDCRHVALRYQAKSPASGQFPYL